MRVFLELYYHQLRIFSTPVTCFAIFLSYIVVTPLMLGLEREFSCHSHLGPIRIPPLFPAAPFQRNELIPGTLELYYFRAFFFTKILLLKWVGHRLLQIIIVFFSFPMLQLPYQLALTGMARLNILFGILVLTLMCGIHSDRSAGIRGKTRNSSRNPTTSPTSLPPTLSRTSIETAEWFHVLSSIGYSSPCSSCFHSVFLVQQMMH